MALIVIEESLARHKDIQDRLRIEIREIKQEIASLVAQLKRDQDPTKMGRIQAQIGVSFSLLLLKAPGPMGLDLCNSPSPCNS